MATVTAKSLSRNSLYAWFMQVWQIGSRFVITPLIITQIGLAGYGTWTLMFGICAYIAMFDTSFGFTYAKYTAEYDQKKDYVGLSQIISSGIALISVVGFAGMVTLWFLRGSILRVLNVPENLLPDAQKALMIVAFCFFLRISIGSVYQILSGLQRMDIQYKLSMLSSALEFGLALILLFSGYGLLGLAVGHLVGQSVGMVSGRIICWRICPELHISPLRISKEGFRRVLSLGGRFQLLTFLNMTGDQGMRMLLSYLTGISSLAIYEIADKLVGLGRTVSSSIIAPLMPAFANLHAGQEHERWENLFIQVSKLVAATAGVSLGFLFVFADRLVMMWTGQDYPLAGWTIRITVCCNYLALLTGVGTASLRGKGTLRLEITYVIVSTAIIFILCIPAILYGGYHAIVLAFTVGQVIGSMWFLKAFANSEGLSFWAFCRDTLFRVSLISTAAATVAYIVRPAVMVSIPGWPARWNAVLDVSIGIPVFVVVTGLLLWFGVFSRRERQNMTHYIMAKDKEAVATSTTVAS